MARLLGCLFFCLIGLFLIVAAIVLYRDTAAMLLSLFGALLCFGFFGSIGVYMLRKMSDPTPALIIDSNGITDNASGVAAGFIPWTDITNITTTAVMSTQFMLIMVRNSEFYIQRQQSWVKKKAMNTNYKMYGSPITLSAAAIDMTFDQLNAAIMQGAQNHYNNVR